MPLKITLGITGTIFLLLAYPMILFIRQEPALSMMLSLYVRSASSFCLPSAIPPRIVAS